MNTTKFPRGVSGNPAGRPPGQTPGAKIRQAIAVRSDDILQSVINAAVNGDMSAAKMLLDRITPSLKPIAQPVFIEQGNTLPETGANVLGATLNGAVAPDIGAMLITALANQGKLVELNELEERIANLEAQHDK